ncbi:hypothetical protein ACNF42_05825 [Cuniculiplasma sp. SKW3]|uniref:hypothetical protein n=1 Tax=unclassified Cuniculiplasma TaxID=2619706 RepID=UPI003FD578E6
MTEELTFQNRSNDEINEIILQIDDFRNDLDILDKKNTNVVYLPKSEILKRNNGKINEEIINQFRSNEIYLLWIILNEPLPPGHQEKLFMNYISESKIKRGIIFQEAQYYDKISFYDKETISIFSNLEEGLTISKSPSPFAVTKNQEMVFFIDNKGSNSQDNEVTLRHSEIHWNYDPYSNMFQYSISGNIRTKYNIDYIVHKYFLTPDREEEYLISTLLFFALLFPVVSEVLLRFSHLSNASYFFDILEVEFVLILTLSFAQLRTKLINYRSMLTASIMLILVSFFIYVV